MKRIYLVFFGLILLSNSGCEELKTVAQSVYNSAGGSGPSTSEIGMGLKQALEVGTKSAVGFLGKEDGYFKDAKAKIPFPTDAIKVANTLRDLGMGSLVDEFVKLMNRGAEKAAKDAVPIFFGAIKQMTFQDAKEILMGPNNAATNFFKAKTQDQLYNLFSPKIKNALDVVNATKVWSDITTQYNKIPLMKPVNTDITDFATHKALDGLFLKIQEQEQKIRTNPGARVTDLLKKVFGSLDK